MPPATCPWSFLELRTISFCEEPLCSWITEPANTWSNLGFVLAGLLILKKGRAGSQIQLVLMGFISVLIGLCSGFFHATSSLLGQTIDFGSMFLLSTFMMIFNSTRWLQKCPRLLILAGLIFLVFSLVFLTLFPSTGIPLFASQFLLALFFEWRIAKTHSSKTGPISYRDLIQLLALFAISLGIWTLDITKVLCKPTNHLFTGHSLWHLLNALAIYFGARFYSQFRKPFGDPIES